MTEQATTNSSSVDGAASVLDDGLGREIVFTTDMIEAIYAAWHGAGVDIAGGDWRRFVGMLPVRSNAKSEGPRGLIAGVPLESTVMHGG